MSSWEQVHLYPLTIEEEVDQMDRAIILSLRENTTSEPNVFEHHDGSRENQLRSQPAEISREERHASLVRTKTTSFACPTSSSGHQRTADVQMDRQSSVAAGSPSPSSELLDCCKVVDTLVAKDENYIKCLMMPWSKRTSPIHVSARKGHEKCITTLLETFPDLVNSADTCGETPLYIACINSNLSVVEKLLQHKANSNINKSSLETPLMAAVDNNDTQIVKTMLQYGAEVNKSLNRGWTVMHEAVYRGHTQVLLVLLENKGNPNILDDFGISPVFTSAACGRNDCLLLLLEYGGNPDLCAKSKSASPLYEACKGGHTKCVITLLRNGANPHLVNCDGVYPIHIASLKGYKEIVKQLLEVTNRHKAETCGISPVHMAAKGDNTDILEMLIEQEYDVNIKLIKEKITYRDRRQTALFFAVYNDSEEATEMLLKAGAETELDYVKPLLVAVSHSQYDVAHLLLSFGANINASFTEDDANFPACIAFALRDFQMLKQVIASGCDVMKCFTCDLGGKDHSTFDLSIRKKMFCHFMTDDSQLPWIGYNILYLLQFAGNVKLCHQIMSAIRHTDQHERIKEITDTPHLLLHLCRLSIRKSISLGKGFIKTITSLPLPQYLKDYLMFADV